MAESSDSNVELVLIVIVVLILVFVVPIIVVIVPIPIVALRIRRSSGGRSNRGTEHRMAGAAGGDSAGGWADRRSGRRPGAAPRTVGSGSTRDKPPDGAPALGRSTHAPLPEGHVPPM